MLTLPSGEYPARLSNVLFGELRDTLFGRVTERAMRRIGLQVFRHVHALDLDFHLNRRTGGLARDIERGTTGVNAEYACRSADNDNGGAVICDQVSGKAGTSFAGANVAGLRKQAST